MQEKVTRFKSNVNIWIMPDILYSIFLFSIETAL